MATARKLLRHPAVASVAAWLGARYLEFIWLTGRWRIENLSVLTESAAAGPPVIVCFWHGRLLLSPRIKDVSISALASHHRDGQLGAMVMRHRGIGMIPGSSGRGGGTGLRRVVRALRRGEVVVITPDGPRGPRMRAAPGAVAAAKLAGARLLPAAFGISRRCLVGKWDRFVIPLPFGRGIVRFGSLISVPGDGTEQEFETVRVTLENQITALTQAVDAELGVEVIHPAPPAATGEVNRT